MEGSVRYLKLGILLLLFLSGLSAAHADIGLMMEEPYGKLGELSPTGHAAIYLSRICAETPTQLRRCRPGEDGVVISRYSSVGRYDWAAIPLIPYLYAVENLEQIPSLIDSATVVQLRDSYRRKHLESLIPDGPNGTMPSGEWKELLGSAYIRQIFVYEIETTPAQDDRLIRALNSNPNKRKFNYFFRNCANFSESILNFYYPHAVHRSLTADLGLVTPKQIAKSLVSYSHVHSDLQFSTFEIPQVPGKIRRSGKICGVVEALLKKKQYAVPLVILHPYVAAALAGTYFTRGRFNPAKNSMPLNRSDIVQALLKDEAPPPTSEIGDIEKPSVHSAAYRRSDECISPNRCPNQSPGEFFSSINAQ